MNIGYLIGFPWYPPKGGGTVHAFQVANQLTKRGHKLHAMYYYREAPNLKVYRQREIFKFLKNIDVLYIRIHGAFEFEMLSLFKILKCFSLPVVWEINAPNDEQLTKGKSQREVNYMTFKRKMLAKFVDTGICVSDTIKEYAQTVLKIKDLHVIPNGSDTQLYSPAKKNESVFQDQKGYFKVIWSGSSDYPWQGVDIILDLALKIEPLDKQIKIILITNKKNIERMKPLPDNVVVIDRVNYTELPPYIASADAGLCIYHNYGWRGKFHFSPLKLFDYMAWGLPVISSLFRYIYHIIYNIHN